MTEDEVAVWWCEWCDQYGDGTEMAWTFEQPGIHDCGHAVSVFVKARLVTEGEAG